MTLWTASQIFTDLWLDASDSSTITIATGVSQWRDKSGNGINAVQATAADQPALVSNYQNSLSVIHEDGAGDHLQLPSGFLSNAANISFFMVRKGISESNKALFGPYDSYSSGLILFNMTTTTTPTIRVNSVEKLSNSGLWSNSGFSIISIIGNSTALSTYCNGASSGNVSGIPALNYNGVYCIGRYYANLYTSNQYVAEIIICATTLDTASRQKIEGYLAWKWGLQSNLPSDHPYYSAAPIATTTRILSLLQQVYPLDGSVRNLLDKPYALLYRVSPSLLDLYYSIRMSQILTQLYGDMPQVRALLDQYYGPAAILQRNLIQKYGNATPLKRLLLQEWNMPDKLLAALEQRYHIAGGQVQALAELVYNLSEYNLIKTLLDQNYIISLGSIQLKANISVVTSQGLSLHPIHISGEVDESEVSLKFEIHLSEDEYLQCEHLETEIIITVNDDVYNLIVEAPRRSRNSVGNTTYIVPLSSKAILLDSPYASSLTKEFLPGMASSIVSDLAALKGVETDWQIIDWYIPASTLYANSETPLQVIRKIKDAVGGVLQSSKDGKLIVRYEYPDPVLEYDDLEPDYFLAANEDFFSVNSAPEINDEFNKFLISNQNSSSVGNRIESIDIDSTTKEVRIYQIPFNQDSNISLGTSGGGWVSIQNKGVVSETITAEQVEIIAGQGQLQKPIYSDPIYVWKQFKLGAITPSEDGHLSTEITENSLMAVTYDTKYRKFLVSSDFIEDVQFYCVEA